MLKYRCLVLDHDDTVVQSMKTLSFPFWCQELELFRPGQTMSLEDYILECHRLGFAGLCREHFQFTDREMELEHRMWMEYILSHTPDPYPGMDAVIRRQKAEGGLVCVVSHSHTDNITRDYLAHFGILPDAIYGWELPPQQRKPNPYPLEDLMERFGLKSQEILVVDDMQLACRMAAPLGIAVAYAGWNGLGIPEIEKEMKALCDFSFDKTEKLYNFLFDSLDNRDIIRHRADAGGEQSGKTVR